MDSRNIVMDRINKVLSGGWNMTKCIGCENIIEEEEGIELQLNIKDKGIKSIHFPACEDCIYEIAEMMQGE